LVVRALPFQSVLVTGANGFVGRYLVAALRDRLLPDAVFACPARGDEPMFDLTDAALVDRIVADQRPDLIVHLAAQSSVGASAGGAAETWRTNVCGTLNLAQAVATRVPTATVAFASSSEVYGAAFNDGPADEAVPPRPLSAYARTKQAGEALLADVLTPTNRLVVFRPSNHSGAGQDTRFVLPAFADQIAVIEAGATPPQVMVGSLTAMRDFLDVRDVVAAYVTVLALHDLRMRETFNIGSGVVRPVSDLLDALLAMTMARITVEQDPERLRPSDVPRAEIDATKLREATGWQPRHTLQDTAASVLEDRRSLRAGGM
jgi:GDP-4-dehydro-6-deoxy-D-mannose reductase